MKLSPISFLGQISHSVRNTVPHLAFLTRNAATLLKFTNIYKSCDTDHSLLRKTQNTEKIGHFLKTDIHFDQYLIKKEC